MARKRCNSCLGEYDDEQPDGTLYFHACAPTWDDRAQRTTERPNKRDENVPRSGGEREGARVVRLRGLGATTI